MKSLVAAVLVGGVLTSVPWLVVAVVDRQFADDGVRPVKVLVDPELAADVAVSEWMGRELRRTRRADGMIEYWGASGPARYDGYAYRGNAGVHISGYHRVGLVLDADVPRGHAMIVRLQAEDGSRIRRPRVSVEPATDEPPALNVAGPRAAR